VSFERVLDEYDVLIFSDVEARSLQLTPRFSDRSKFGNEPLTFPDRVRLTVEAIYSGKHAVFLGGWLSFNGEMGKGGWGQTGLRTILPVTCLEYEDLRESTEGYVDRTAVVVDIDLPPVPPILGYNIVRPREGSDVVAIWEIAGAALLAVVQFDKGRVLAYTSSGTSAEGCAFICWDQCNRVWAATLDWLRNET
jgi:uncharacterized membrane protein